MPKVDNYIKFLNAFYAWEEQHPLTYLQECILMRILRRVNKAGWTEWVKISNDEIIRELRIPCKNTFISNRNHLIEVGLIQFVSGKKNKPSSYKLNMPVRKEIIYCFESENSNVKKEYEIGYKGIPRIPKVIPKVIPNIIPNKSETPRHVCVPGGAKQETINYKHIPPKSTNVDFPPTCTDDEHGGDEQAQIPVENKSELKPNPKPKAKTKVPGSEIDTLFAEFWSAYPRKVAKQAAQRAFAKLKPDRKKLDEILDGIARYKKSEQWEDKQFIPHPATFLSGARWEDEVEPREGFKTSYDLEAYKKMSRDMLMHGIEADRQSESEEVPWFKNTDPSFWWGENIAGD